ncbi:unnamed protein product, partial [Rotaria magnacalcarata]
NEDDLRSDYYDAPPQVTTANYNNANETEIAQYTFEQYRVKLIVSIL